MKDIPEKCRHVFGELISVMAAESNVNISRAITGFICPPQLDK